MKKDKSGYPKLTTPRTIRFTDTPSYTVNDILKKANADIKALCIKTGGIVSPQAYIARAILQFNARKK